jgi:hypothetical protein
MRTVIELPCSVGDIVWARSWYYGEAGNWKPWQVTNLTVTQNKKGIRTKKFRAMRLENGKTTALALEFGLDDVGNIDFLEEPHE